MLSSLFLISCIHKQPPSSVSSINNENHEAHEDLLQIHAELAFTLWSNAFADAEKLKSSISLFLEDPTEENLSSAREAWRVARHSYSQTEALRFQSGPIDHPDIGVESRLNAWPLDEQYIESSDGQSGLINNKDVELSRVVLIEKNEALGEESISLGYHAIEFLLWGIDDQDTAPGQRSHTDYLNDPLAARRGLYLSLTTEQLSLDLQTVKKAWAPDQDNHRSSWSKGTAQELEGIFNGLIMLAGDELAGERMAVAYETRDQEDEQSCFSDNTLADFKSNLVGMRAIWETSLAPLFSTGEPKKTQALKLEQQFELTQNRLELITVPFDQAIISEEHRPSVEHAMSALEKLASELSLAAELLGLQTISEGGH